MILARTTLVLTRRQTSQLRRAWKEAEKHGVRAMPVIGQPHICTDGDYNDPATVAVVILNGSVFPRLQRAITAAISAPLKAGEVDFNRKKGGAK